MLVGYASRLQHGNHVVGTQTVAADLAKHGHADNANEAAAGGVGIPELVVVVPLLVRRFGRDLLHHLLHLQLDHGVADAALSVVCCKHLGGILVPVLGHEPSRALGEPKDAQADNARGDHLAPDRDAPGVQTVNVSAAVNDPRGDNAANVPRAVVKPGQGPAPFGVGHLGDIARGRDAAEADAKAKHEAAGQELAGGGAGSLDACADDDNQGANKHPPPTAEIVVDGPGEEDGGHGPDVVHGKDKAGARARRGPNQALLFISTSPPSSGLLWALVAALTC